MGVARLGSQLRLPIAAALFCLLGTPASLLGQFAATGGSILVHVRLPDGSSLDRGAIVNLFTLTGASVGTSQMKGGLVDFEGIPEGRYTLEVVAPGYQKDSEQVELTVNGERVQVYVTMRPESTASAGSQHSSAPILAPDAQKELSKTLEALRASKLEEAKKHLEKLSRKAPANPDVNYVWGIYYAQSNDWAHARGYWEKAIQIYPQHAFSLAALGQAALQDGDLPAAIGFLGRAVAASPSSWHFEERLAEAYLLHDELAQAQKHAEHAIELGKDRASPAQLILARVFLRQNQPQLAQKALTSLLAAQPSGPDSQQAQQLLEALKHPVAASTPSHPLQQLETWDSLSPRRQPRLIFGRNSCLRRSGCHPMSTRACLWWNPAPLVRCSRSRTRWPSAFAPLSMGSTASARPRRWSTKSSIDTA